MAGSANSIQTHNVLRGRLSEDNVIAGTVGTGYNPTYALVGEAAAQIVLYINSSDYKMYAELKDKNGNHIMNSNIIDLPLETMVVNGSYDSETKEVVLILDNGNELRFSVADLVRGLVSEEDLTTTLRDYVKFTDYATSSTAGVVKTGKGIYMSSGVLTGSVYDYANYQQRANDFFISKGTLENVITGKQLVNKTYVDEADEVFEEDLFGDTSIIDSGENIILNNTIEKAPLSITLKGNTYQDSTSGKNLLNTLKKYNAGQTITQDGITVKFNNDGSLTFNGTATNNVNIYITDTGNLFNLNGTYTLSCSDTDKNIMFFMWSSSSVQGGVNTSTTYTKENVTIDRLSVRAIGGNTFNNVTIYPQLEQGSQVTSYEPYTGRQPSPNPDYPQEIEVVTGLNEVKVEGKNLINGLLNDSITGKELIRTINSNEDFYLYIESSSTTTDKVYGFLNNEYKGTINVSNNNGILTFSGSQNFSFNRIRLQSDIIATKNMLTLGATAIPYEAYKGQTYEINLGKNLFNQHLLDEYNGTTRNGILFAIQNDGGIKLSGTSTYSGETNFSIGDWNGTTPIIDLDSNKTYTVSITGNTANIVGFNIKGLKNEASTKIIYGGDTSSTVTITGFSSITYISVIVYGTQTINTTLRLQLEKGDTPTTYAPYFNPIELCKIGTYQDRIYKNNGNWYLHKEITKQRINSTNGTIELNGFRNDGNFSTDLKPATAYPVLYSKYFTYGASYSDSVNERENTPNKLGLNSSGQVLCNISGYTTSQQYVTYFTNNDVYVYYPLATPTDTQITDTTLINQLNALYNATSYNTQTNISQVNINLPFILDISTFKNTTKGKIEVLEQEDENYERLSNKVIELSSSSTDTEYPSAKCVYNLVGNIESILETLDIGNGV